MPNKMSELIDYILELPNTKDFWKDDMRPSIETIGDLKLCLYELTRMCESIYPNTSIPERLIVENQMIEIAKTIKQLGGHFSESLDVDSNGIVRDGKGFIYCGHSNKKYIIGEDISENKTKELIHELRPTCKTFLPIIMFSHVVSTKKQLEHYYYFKPIITDDQTIYRCFKISNSIVSGNSFNHYLCKRLTRIHRLNYTREYESIQEGKRLTQAEIMAFPMGTILVFNDQTLIKNTPIGSNGFWKAYYGAIDI